MTRKSDLDHLRTFFPSLAGQHVVVVGGSSGIGLAAARRAKEAGADITLVARSVVRLREAAASIGGAKQCVADLCEPATVREILRNLPCIDHLVITAGTASLSALEDTTPDDLQRIVTERLIGPLLAIQAALTRLRASGSITLTSAQLASRPLGVGAAIAGAVAATEAMARALALELAPIRVNAVAPGMTDTPLLDSLLGSDKAQILEGVAATLPVKRIGSSDAVASAMLLLMTNEFVTGEVLHVDGGGRWV
jgi:NAD(P)-dependent dehydrogenase (short-subunit alcohol dehydrogenase family)